MDLRPVIFSGTTEGRTLSEALSAMQTDHIVCVATGYGRLVMHPDEHADVREGRLDADQMKDLISVEGSIVFDATHPYADAVSENIRSACEETGREYVRIYRPETSVAGDIRYFDSPESCAEALAASEGNILLTTGSKDLKVFTAKEGLCERLYVRVLPSEESIRLCSDAGITGRNVIAMQGPFSAQLNSAVIKHFGISIMVTKSSGRAGGLPEKLKAAADAGISVYMIGRPQEETGLTVDEALRKYFSTGSAARRHIHIDLVGTGPGDASHMTREASEAVKIAGILFGAGRMIASYQDRPAYPYYRAKDIIPVIEEKCPERIAVLFSGDTGFSSGALRMKKELSSWLEEKGYEYEINTLPGISSFAYFAAVTGEDYTDAGLISLHGRSDDRIAVADFISTVKRRNKTVVLLSGDKDVRKIGTLLNDNKLSNTTVTLGYQLSYPEEEILHLTHDECLNIEKKGLYIAVITNPDAHEPLLMPVIADDKFIRGKVPMTKESVRHLSILRLGLRKGSVLYDIGSGSGSIACESAGLSDSVSVYAIEMKDEACELIRSNAEAFGASNITVVKGCAPEALAGLTPPTHAFIGGSNGRLMDIINSLPDGTRVVINAVSLETIAEIQSAVREFDIEDLNIEQVSVSRSRELGRYHLMTAENPVMIASFTLRGQIQKQSGGSI